MVYEMREEIMFRMTRPEEGERGLGVSHRRGGTGWDSYRRPPEGAHLRNFPVGKRGASATSKAPGVKRKVESMRDKGAKRPANRKLHIDDGCMGGGNGNIPHPADGKLDWADGYVSADFYDYKGSQANPTQYFDWAARKDIFHYCIIAHQVTLLGDDADGWGEGPQPTDPQGTIGGDDFSMTDVGNNQAELFMHELGHNLGLTDKPTKSGKAMYRGPGYTGHVDYTSTDWNVIDLTLFINTPGYSQSKLKEG